MINILPILNKYLNEETIITRILYQIGIIYYKYIRSLKNEKNATHLKRHLGVPLKDNRTIRQII